MPPELMPLSREELGGIIVTERAERIAERDALRSELAAARAEAAAAQATLDYVAKQLFTPSSEKKPYTEKDGTQQTLFTTPVEQDSGPAPETEIVVPAHPRRKKGLKGHGRKPVSRELPVVERIIHATDAEKIGPNGETLVVLGYEISRKLDITPAVLRCLVTKREKVGLPDTHETLFVASVEPCLIPKGKATDAFIVDVILNKYQLSLPLYRQVSVLNARGADINVSWMSDLIKQAATIFAPVHNALRDYLLRQRLVYVDETPVRQLIPGKNKHNGDTTVYTSYYWAWIGGDSDRAQCYFHYDTTRSQSALRTVLHIPDDDPWDTDACIALLMCDGYAAYNLIDTVPMTHEQQRIQRIACWVHVRRPFLKCAELGDKNAADIVALINKLFNAERTIRKDNDKKNRRGADAHAYTLSERQMHIKPIIEQIKTTINTCRPYYTPARDMAKAITYTLTLWDSLIAILQHGDAPIDNNTAERAIRPLAIGRKNWLFVGSEDAGNWSAIFFSLIESCRLQKIDPRKYFTYITPILVQRKPNTDYTALIPIAIKDKLANT
jgi:transposase